jgi:predicted kinase
MSLVTLTVGLPASGKSTWAKRQVATSYGKVVRVNMDDIRAMLGLPYSKEAEDLALRIQDQTILTAISQGKNVIVDNCHLTNNMPKRIKKALDGSAVFQVESFLDVTVEEAIHRDSLRSTSVGEDVIRNLAKHLSKTWRLTEEWMNDIKISPLYEPKPGSDAAVVFDIDGTLAKHVSRSPYDYSRVLFDETHEHVVRLLKMYWDSGYEVLIVSGRPDSCREDTETWLWMNDIQYSKLLMRKVFDGRDDREIKQEIFDNHIRDNYRVHMWFDDRNRVVNRMRKLGINVAQVAEGDF